MAEIEEVARYTNQKVFLDIYGTDATALPTATLDTSASTPLPPLTVAPETGNPAISLHRYSVSLGIAHTQSEGDLALTWNFDISGTPVSKTDYFEVVSPILSDGAIRKIHPNATDDEVIAIERAVRHIIQAHTGQTFGYFVGTKPVRGQGNGALLLPAHLISIDTINGFDATTSQYMLADDGWTLYNFPWGPPFGIPPVKADAFGVNDVTFQTGGVIFNPFKANVDTWPRQFSYEISGEWGYKATPAAVAEAAKLLVNDYACGDAQYRDRYLTSMTAADWRIQYNSGAFRETGNVRADQLLQEFVIKRGWAVL